MQFSDRSLSPSKHNAFPKFIQLFVCTHKIHSPILNNTAQISNICSPILNDRSLISNDRQLPIFRILTLRHKVIKIFDVLVTFLSKKLAYRQIDQVSRDLYTILFLYALGVLDLCLDTGSRIKQRCKFVTQVSL